MSQVSQETITPRAEADNRVGRSLVKCPRCGNRGSSVYDSRVRSDGSIWRRRECLTVDCGHCWTTEERIILSEAEKRWDAALIELYSSGGGD